MFAQDTEWLHAVVQMLHVHSQMCSDNKEGLAELLFYLIMALHRPMCNIMFWELPLKVLQP